MMVHHPPSMSFAIASRAMRLRSAAFVYRCTSFSDGVTGNGRNLVAPCIRSRRGGVRVALRKPCADTSVASGGVAQLPEPIAEAWCV